MKIRSVQDDGFGRRCVGSDMNCDVIHMILSVTQVECFHDLDLVLKSRITKDDDFN